MAEFYFIGPNLMWSIIFSIVLSIVLSIVFTIFLNPAAKRQIETDLEFENMEETNHEEMKTKSSGLILIGPIPIVIENGKIRFSKKIFVYALLFLVIFIIGYQIIRIVL